MAAENFTIDAAARFVESTDTSMALPVVSEVETRDNFSLCDGIGRYGQSSPSRGYTKRSCSSSIVMRSVGADPPAAVVLNDSFSARAVSVTVPDDSATYASIDAALIDCC